MPVPKQLKSFLRKEFNDDVWEELCDQAAWNKIRACEAICTSRSREDGIVTTNKRHLSHYFTSFSRVNFTARQKYLKSVLRKEGLDLTDELAQVQKNMEERLSHLNATDGDITQEQMLAELSAITGKSMNDLERTLERMQEVIQKSLETIMQKMETGRFYPWDRINYKIKKIDLSELPQDRYKGPTLQVVVNNGIITDMKL